MILSSTNPSCHRKILSLKAIVTANATQFVQSQTNEKITPRHSHKFFFPQLDIEKNRIQRYSSIFKVGSPIIFTVEWSTPPPRFFHQTTKLFLFRAKLSTNVLAKEWPVVQSLLRFKKTPRQRGNERSEKKNNECKHSSYTNSTHSFPDYPQRIQEIFQVASLQFQKVSNQQCFKTLTFQSKKPDSSIHRKTYRYSHFDL